MRKECEINDKDHSYCDYFDGHGGSENNNNNNNTTPKFVVSQ